MLTGGFPLCAVARLLMPAMSTATVMRTATTRRTPVIARRSDSCSMPDLVRRKAENCAFFKEGMLNLFSLETNRSLDAER